MKTLLSAFTGLLILTLLACGSDPATLNNDIKKSESSENSNHSPTTQENKPISPRSLPEDTVTINSVIPEGFLIMDTAQGDLNKDGKTDLLLILKNSDEVNLSNTADGPVKRPLLILIRDLNNKLQPTRRNDDVVLCYSCGGVYGDPYTGMTIKNGYFSIEHYGGSNWRWTRIVTFKYVDKEAEWYLHKDGGESYHTSDPDKEIESTIRTTKDFGNVRFTEFDVYETH